MPKKRTLKQPGYQTLRLHKRIKHPKPPLPAAFRLFGRSLKTLKVHWWLFGGITVVYAVLSLILVKGFGTTAHIAQLKSLLEAFSHGANAQFNTGFTLFSVLLTNVGNSGNPHGNVYQTILLLIISLVAIWALRQVTSSKRAKVTIRDAFYKSLYPLIPFLLLLIVVALELFPIVVANFLYGVVFNNGVAVGWFEIMLWGLLLGLLVLFSLYLLTSTIFALYIVTLPNITPMTALRSARELVRHRRFMVMRKLIFLPAVLLALAVLIVVPVIFLAPVAAEWVFFAFSMIAVVVVHSYMYTLYRELL
jgi:hypothetical protein